MATLTLQTVGESVSWPGASAGNGMCVAALIKRPAASDQSRYHYLGIKTSGGSVVFGLLFYGNTAGNNSIVVWNNAGISVDTTNDTPVDNKRALVMVGYEDDGATVDVYAQWKDEDGTGVTKSHLNQTRPSWPPASGEPFIETDLSNTLIDELLVFDVKYTSALFDAVYTEMFT